MLFGREGEDPRITYFVAACSAFSFSLTGGDQLPRQAGSSIVGLSLLGLERHGIKLEHIPTGLGSNPINGKWLAVENGLLESVGGR